MATLLRLWPSLGSSNRNRTIFDILTGPVQEITAEDVAGGMDIQGIPFDKLPFSRESYRASRMRHVSDNQSEPPAAPTPDLAIQPRTDSDFFSFLTNSRRMQCDILHPELRNLCWATSRNDVYGMHNRSIVHWDAETKQKSVVLDLSGSAQTNGVSLPAVKISTTIARENLVIAGGFDGDIVASNLGSGTVAYKGLITTAQDAITNAMDSFDDQVMISSNDGYVRCLDLESWQLGHEYYVGSPVNHATRQPICKMVCAVGDDKLVHLLDGDSCRPITELRGHQDFSFATAWHPGGHTFATGSDDRTFRVWDVRNMSESLHVVAARKWPVRSLRFSACGRFLAVAEMNDFVRVFDVTDGTYDTCQEIDFFGEIAGLSFTPESKALFVAVSDCTFWGLMEYSLNESGDEST